MLSFDTELFSRELAGSLSPDEVERLTACLEKYTTRTVKILLRKHSFQFLQGSPIYTPKYVGVNHEEVLTALESAWTEASSRLQTFFLLVRECHPDVFQLVNIQHLERAKGGRGFHFSPTKSPSTKYIQEELENPMTKVRFGQWTESGITKHSGFFQYKITTLKGVFKKLQEGEQILKSGNQVFTRIKKVPPKGGYMDQWLVFQHYEKAGGSVIHSVFPLVFYGLYDKQSPDALIKIAKDIEIKVSEVMAHVKSVWFEDDGKSHWTNDKIKIVDVADVINIKQMDKLKGILLKGILIQFPADLEIE
mmetsp:Transcript_42709/g.69245  ORF Transcript_42709/g.69245 Transcript_42709/m.69245 type:complete len:306 (-) Transcript_42709:332-1249(-)